MIFTKHINYEIKSLLLFLLIRYYIKIQLIEMALKIALETKQETDDRLESTERVRYLCKFQQKKTREE